MDTRARQMRSGLGIGLAIACMWSSAEAKVRFFTLAEKTRGSEVVLIGRVTELGPDHILVDVGKTIKGSMPDKQIKVMWDRSDEIEKPVAHHQLGDEILLFANKTGAQYDPFSGGQGTLKLQKGWADQYEALVRAIVAHDGSGTTEEKLKLLSSMVAGDNRLIHDAALLEILHLDAATRRSEMARKELVPRIIRLAKGGDRDVAIRAAQTLDSVGGMEAASALVELVGSEHGAVAEVASRALSQKTGIKREVKSRQSISERQNAKREWEAWWKQNKGRVKLRE